MSALERNPEVWASAPDEDLGPGTDSTFARRIDSENNGRCDSPVEPREKATDPYVNPTGNLTLLFQLERRADLHVSTRVEA